MEQGKLMQIYSCICILRKYTEHWAGPDALTQP